MENIERTQFVVLTGHLDDQPLPHLIRRLRAQRKSGRLQVEYPDAPGSFFFKDGQLVDAQMGALRGVDALYAALALDGASFNFNPLIRPPERSIDRQEQQFIWDLIEGPRREGLAEIKVAGREIAAPSELPAPARNEPLQLAPVPAEVIAPLEARLSAVEAAIVSTSRRFSRERLIYMVVIGFLVGLGSILALNVILGPFFGDSPATTREVVSAPPSSPTNGGGAGVVVQQSPAFSVKKELEAAAPVGTESGAIPTPTNSKPKANDSPPRGNYVVQVLVEVKSGQVTGARVWNPRPGARAYEARALKLAKQHRYPEGFTGSERLKIKVTP